MCHFLTSFVHHKWSNKCLESLEKACLGQFWREKTLAQRWGKLLFWGCNFQSPTAAQMATSHWILEAVLKKKE